jgi:hypothetical protein
LEREMIALKDLRNHINSLDFVDRVFSQVFYEDIIRLRDMKDLWTQRAAPIPISHEDARETLALRGEIRKVMQFSQHSLLSLEDNIEMFYSR